MKYLVTPTNKVYHLCSKSAHGLPSCLCGMGSIAEDIITSWKPKKKLCKHCKKALDNKFLEDI